jgi:uncharacterized protein (DUF1778 family)
VILLYTPVVRVYASMYYYEMKAKSNRLQLRLWKQDYAALKALAAGEGLTMTAYLVKYIRQEAKKQGIPTKEVI